MDRFFHRIGFPQTVVSCAAFVFVGVVLSLRVWADPSPTVPPSASGPSVENTDKEFFRERMEFERGRLADAYKSVGNKNAKWDADALGLFDKTAAHIVYGKELPPFRPAGLPTPGQLAKLGEELHAKGCDDGAVGYCHAVALADLHRDGAALEQFRLCLKRLKEGHYPPDLIVSAASGLLRLRMPLSADEKGDLAATIKSGCVATARGVRPNKAHRRILLAILRDALRDDRQTSAQVVTELKALADADPWLLNVIDGENEVTAGWDARGTKFAIEVTPEGWKGFHEHLEKARTCFTKAWELEPTLPDAAENMIKVAMGGEAAEGETARMWFDRATQAKFDDAVAFEAMQYALFPRWGGSHEEMWNLGLESARTKRFDTKVPLRLVETVERISTDDKDPECRILLEPNVYAAVQKVFQGYEQQMEPGPGRDWMTSWHAAIAWRAGKFDEARKLLDALGDRVAVDRWVHVTRQPELCLAETYALSGPLAPRVLEALHNADNDKAALSIKQFKEIAADPAADKPTVFYCTEQVMLMEFHARFESGEWSDLQPKGALHMWTARKGRWNVDGQGRMQGMTDGSGLLIFCMPALGDRYEVTATVEFKSPEGEYNAVGLALDHLGGTFGSGVFVSTRDGEVYTYAAYASNQEKMEPVKASTIQVRYWDHHYTATVNGRPVKLPGPGRPEYVDLGDSAGLAITSLFPATETTLYVTDLKARKLTEKPAEIPEGK
ncbi:MAG: hypothetical protein JWL69_171 [Phycisphaerales bacterium]|nr:hypothetical protein [Phycisphaerales bacterium]